MQYQYHSINKVLSPYLTVPEELKDKPFKGFTHSSNDAEPGQVFLALEGQNSHGLKYLLQALNAGAIYCLAQNSPQGLSIYKSLVPELQDRVVLVESPKEILKSVAHTRRIESQFPIIGVTGTVGKTSFKSFASQCLYGEKIFYSKKNWNNIFGLMLNLSALPFNVEAGVFECGISKVGEMKDITDLLKPEYVVLTNIEESHLETMKTVDNVAKEKSILSRYAKVVLLTEKSYYQLKQVDALQKAQYLIHCFEGDRVNTQSSDKAKYVLCKSEKHSISVDNNQYTRSSIFKSYDSLLSLLVSCTAIIRIYDGLDINLDLKQLKELKGRGRKIEFNPFIDIIDHSYNCSPGSLRMILEKLRGLESYEKKILIVGDISEQIDSYLLTFLEGYTALLKHYHIEYYHVGTQKNLWPDGTPCLSKIGDLKYFRDLHNFELKVIALTASRSFAIDEQLEELFINKESI